MNVGGIGWCVVAAMLFLGNFAVFADDKSPIPGGELRIVSKEGKDLGACPLKTTEVQADIVGFVSRVRVKQVFYNPLDEKIEAVYVFPLPQEAAVDDMVMIVGDRRVVGRIKPRDEARAVYEAARAAGHVAGLLDQERPNIFTQSVANIEPGVQVTIEISYVEVLKYEDGVFEFVFPMVVGPRYIPGGGSAPAPMTTGTPTDQVPDAERITPPVTPPGTQAGHDISLTVNIEAGMELFDIESKLHEVNVERSGPGQVTITLKKRAVIPNKDFILRYRTATEDISDAVLVHSGETGAFFTLVLQPPRRVKPEQAVPKEMIFVLDTSGSMRGFPIEKAKETMRLCIDKMNPKDTFNLITFAGDTRILWPGPRPNTTGNRNEAQEFLASRRGRGGTEMMKAINAALQAQAGSERVRIVCFMTDGYVGNDFAIIDAVKKNAGTTRVFSFGIGNSVNRFLLDGMAHAGRGEVEYVTLKSQGDRAAERFHERIHSPVLTDIEIDWGAVPVADVYPRRIPDLFSAKPIMIHGRLTGAADGTITLRGRTADGAFERRVTVARAGEADEHDALASLWARSKVKHLMHQDLTALQRGNFPEEIKKQITDLGVEFRLLTQFTSFVAVEEMTVTVGGEPKKIMVPVEMPEGVSYEGVFGPGSEMYASARPMVIADPARGVRTYNAPSRGSAGSSVYYMQNRLGRKVASADLSRLATEAADRERDPVKRARAKLAEPLRDLADKVAKQGRNGNLTVGKLRVIDYKVDVMIYLGDTSAKTMAALKKLGFVQAAESKAVRLVIGTIDVRKLEDLAKLGAVIHVAPVAK